MSETPPQENFKEEYACEPLVMKPEWLTPDIERLVQQAYETEDFSILPILADALEEASCTDDRILRHLRSPSCPHHKNCWALGLLRGQELNPQISDQLQLYATHFNREPDMSTVELPERTKEQEKEFTRLLIIDKKLTTEEVYQACKKQFPCYHYQESTSLDQLTDPTQEERNPQTQGSYALWARDTQHADLENRNLSANDIKERNLQTMTLAERLLLELDHWDKNSQNPNETQHHLDSETTETLYAGSRTSDGHVPRVYWNSGARRLYVYWCAAGRRHDDLRARSVVSLAAKSKT